MTTSRPPWHADPDRLMRYRLDRLPLDESMSADPIVPGQGVTIRRVHLQTYAVERAGKTRLRAIGPNAHQKVIVYLHSLKDEETPTMPVLKLTPEVQRAYDYVSAFANGCNVSEINSPMITLLKKKNLIIQDGDRIYAADRAPAPNDADDSAPTSEEYERAVIETTRNEMRLAIMERLPTSLIVWGEDNPDVSTVDIKATLSRIAESFSKLGKKVEELQEELHLTEQAASALQNAMEFTADELESIGDIGYTHAQKNGILMHVANRLRRWRDGSRSIIRVEIPF